MTRVRLLGGVVLVLALVTGCGPGPLEAPPPREASGPIPLPASSATTAAPSGRVTVAYPDEPGSGPLPPGRDLAHDDLAALWGLPLLRLDEAGQLRRGLVDDWEVVGGGPDGWQVRLGLREGSWTDDSPVTANDVVATLRARVEQDPERFGALTEVRADGEAAVLLAFDGPFAGWADLLVEAGPVVPGGGTADAGGLTGGWFRLADREPGRSMTFEAHTEGPLGAPGLASIEVLFTPSFETALGLLEDDRVDVLVGYLPLNGVSRAREVERVDAAAPFGGTTVALEFRDGGALGGGDEAARRRGVLESVDVSELVEGLLGAAGEAATSPWPEVEGPEPPVGEAREGQELVLLFPRGSELLAFTSRSLQRDLVSRGMTVDLVSEPAPRFAAVLGEERDLALVPRRPPPRPALGPWVDEVERARAANAAAPGSAAARTGLEAVAETARYGPLYHPGVLHAWRGIDGIRPSSWVGAGFWNVGEWQVAGD